MDALKRFVVPVELIVLGEDEADAVSYAREALEHCDLLEQDGIVGISDDFDDEDVFEDEHDML